LFSSFLSRSGASLVAAKVAPVPDDLGNPFIAARAIRNGKIENRR